MITESSQQALDNLRDGSHFAWYVPFLVAVALYMYAVEIERRNWNVLFCGLAFWVMDWFNEIWNALVLHFSGHAAVWIASGPTALLLLVGLNLEICLMFLVSGIVFGKMLLPDPKTRILGIPNRMFMAVSGSILYVAIECFLNLVGSLSWTYSWWSARAPWLVFFVGYMPFFLVAFWVHDMRTVRAKAITVGIISSIDIAALLVFGAILGWI